MVAPHQHPPLLVLRRGCAPNPTRALAGPQSPTPGPRGAHCRAPWSCQSNAAPGNHPGRRCLVGHAQARTCAPRGREVGLSGSPRSVRVGFGAQPRLKRSGSRTEMPAPAARRHRPVRRARAHGAFPHLARRPPGVRQLRSSGGRNGSGWRAIAGRRVGPARTVREAEMPGERITDHPDGGPR